jgi:PAS domain S-box-containing protein
VPVETSLKIGHMVRDRRPRLTNRIQAESWLNEPEWASREGLVAYAGYPLIAEDRVVGVMAMFSRQALSDRTLQELGTISGGLAQCIIRSQTEESLRTSEERLSLAIEGVGMAMWDWNLTTGEMIWSDRHFALFGYDPQTTEASFETWRVCVHPMDLGRVMEELERTRRERVSYACDYRIVQAKTGEVVWIASRGRYLCNDAGEPVRMIGGLFNISHRKQTEEQIRQFLYQAQCHEKELREKQAQLVQAAKLASIGELTTGVGHELNNPLNNIGLYVGNALDEVVGHVDGPVRERLVASLRGAKEQIRRATSIVDHLRMFGRSTKQNYEPVAINDVIGASLDFLAEHLRLATINVAFAPSRKNPSVKGCQIQLEQVFVNLIVNACDAMRETPVKKLHITSDINEKRLVEVRIEDSGVGIPAAVLPRIFDPFFTTKEVGSGTGLGLSITYGIIKEHHGDITVQSEEGHGTLFIIQIPL